MDAFRLLRSASFGVQTCQLLVTVPSNEAKMREFLLQMKYRAYMAFTITSWEYKHRSIWKREERMPKEENKVRMYSISLVKLYCMKTKTDEYDFGDKWING